MYHAVHIRPKENKKKHNNYKAQVQKKKNMEQKAPQIEPQSQKASLHQSDADDDDENVKQLNECSSLYLSLQVFFFFFF